MSMGKPRSLFIPTIFVLIAAVVLLLPACGNNKPFDSAAWLKADLRERGRMAEDLVNNKILIGQHLDQAKLLLGEPEKDWVDLGWPRSTTGFRCILMKSVTFAKCG